jgi:hypothetical protein
MGMSIYSFTNEQQETKKATEQADNTLNTDKQKMIIAGWSVQESHGYFRAFKRIAGKMKGVYLGKTLEDWHPIQYQAWRISGGGTVTRRPEIPENPSIRIAALR